MSTTATQSTDDLNQVIPTVKTMTFGGQSIEIKQFKVGRLPLVMLAIQPISHMLTNLMPGEKLDVPGMFVMYSGDCLQLLAILANKSREWADDLELDEAVELFGHLLEVNLDFFISRVLPQLIKAMERLAQQVEDSTQAVQALGQIVSKASSKAVTTLTTS